MTGIDYARQARADIQARDARITALLNLWRLYGFDLWAWDGQIGHAQVVIRRLLPNGTPDPHCHITGYMDNTFREWVYTMTLRGRSAFSFHTPAAGSMPDDADD